MKALRFLRDGWVESTLEDPGEARTLVRLRITVGEASLTRNYSRRGGGSSDSINAPLFPLARALAETWWTLLYEPFRAGADAAFRARHRRAIPMHGYVFPAIALRSGGNETLLAAWAPYPDEHARIEFLTPASEIPELLARNQAEAMLMDVVETTLDRLRTGFPAYDDLASAWDRVQVSMSDLDEFAYCRAAGRLGIDTYDPLSPDLTAFTSQIDPSLFEDIADAAFVEELQETTDWVRDAQARLTRAPSVDVTAFGEHPVYSPAEPAWKVGALAAELSP